MNGGYTLSSQQYLESPNAQVDIEIFRSLRKHNALLQLGFNFPHET